MNTFTSDTKVLFSNGLVEGANLKDGDEISCCSRQDDSLHNDGVSDLQETSTYCTTVRLSSLRRMNSFECLMVCPSIYLAMRFRPFQLP